MKILGIETSCDETSAAVVENGTRVLSNVIASQIPLHKITGGVVPEVAAREHVLKILPVIEEALSNAGVALEEIDAIAVTQGPGLLSSLIIGVTAANTLAMFTGKTLIPVNHIAGHIYANWLEERADDPVQFPIMVLTVSGGHNELVYMKSHADFKMVGETLDDAAGEAFDKVARLLGLGYPGGPEISKAAAGLTLGGGGGTGANGGPVGDAKRFKFPIVHMGKDNFDFSFSGLKTAVLTKVKEEFARSGKLDKQFIADCAASFQEAVCQVLTDKLLRAAQEYSGAGLAEREGAIKEVHLAGGVSANSRLREMCAEKIAGGFYYDHLGRKIPLKIKPKLRYSAKLSYCTDNAAMIASTAYFHHKKAPHNYVKLGPALANPSLRMYEL